jgi:hypothetical protein
VVPGVFLGRCETAFRPTETSSDTSTLGQLLESISINCRHGPENAFGEMRTQQTSTKPHFLQPDFQKELVSRMGGLTGFAAVQAFVAGIGER